MSHGPSIWDLWSRGWHLLIIPNGYPFPLNLNVSLASISIQPPGRQCCTDSELHMSWNLFARPVLVLTDAPPQKQENITKFPQVPLLSSLQEKLSWGTNTNANYFGTFSSSTCCVIWVYKLVPFPLRLVSAQWPFKRHWSSINSTSFSFSVHSWTVPHLLTFVFFFLISTAFP